MTFDVAFTADAVAQAAEHLLAHYDHDNDQEDLCFGLWRPSSGATRQTALISEIILPEPGDQNLHGNVSFEPAYHGRAIELALERQTGLAFMHSHPTPGWQGLSHVDELTERDVLAYPAMATGLPLLGLTVGSDGYWSARLWEKQGRKMVRHDCSKVRVPTPSRYRLYYNDRLMPPPRRRDILRRTYDTWGTELQNDIARLRVGIVGLGSVGSIVAEAIARVGVARITLIDHDNVELHNLDRLLHASQCDIGRKKVDVAAQSVQRHATAEASDLDIAVHPARIQQEAAYRAALDCDVLFSCVDNAIARDALNYAALAHLIPVIDGGVFAELLNDRFHAAQWKAHLVTPGTRCLRCVGQVDTSRLSAERAGLFEDETYIGGLPPDAREAHLNVFPFCLSVASMEVNLMLRYCIALDWWPRGQEQGYQFVDGTLTRSEGTCRPQCEFNQRIALGDSELPQDLQQGDGQTGQVRQLGLMRYSLQARVRRSRLRGCGGVAAWGRRVAVRGWRALEQVRARVTRAR